MMSSPIKIGWTLEIDYSKIPGTRLVSYLLAACCLGVSVVGSNYGMNTTIPNILILPLLTHSLGFVPILKL